MSDFSKENPRELFIADESEHRDELPWTIFAYPMQFADDRLCPTDSESKRFLETLRWLGSPVRAWKHPDIAGTVYVVCAYESRQAVEADIHGLERAGWFPENFVSRHSEYLFSLIDGGK